MSGSVYAKPAAPRIMIVPALTTLAMHLALVAALTMNWSGFEEPVIKVKPLPKVINAKLVDIESFRPKPKPGTYRTIMKTQAEGDLGSRVRRPGV